MADEPTNETPPADTAPVQDAPQPWWMIGLGLAGAGALAMAAAALGILFMQTRPANLLSQTESLAGIVENTLRQNVSPQKILKSAPTLETAADNSARWYSYDYEVEVPPNLNTDGVKELLRDTMLDHRVSLVEAPGTPTQRTLRLALGDYAFADVVLFQTAPVLPESRDLRPEAYRVARDAEQTLLDSGVKPAGLLRYEPEDQQDGNTLWATTRIDIELPEGITANSLAAAIESRLVDQDVAVDIIDGDGGATMHVLYEGKVCADIRCTRMMETNEEDMPELGDILPDLKPDADDLPPESESTPLESVDTEEDTMPETDKESEPEEAPEETENKDEAEPAVPVNGLSLEPPKAREQPRNANPRVAIILDDGGWGGETTNRVLELDSNLTLAILPYSDQDEDTALAAAERGFEIMLHMPMETYAEGEKPYQSELRANMNKEDVQRLARNAIAEIPGLAGINNHRGSKFTDDAERMRWFLEVVEEKSLYFIDSVTLHTSQAYNVAQDMAIPSTRRDVFLDHENEPAYIRQQFEELIDTAKRNGEAVGIGHFRGNTIDVLEEMLPRLREEGIELVHASELVR